MNKTIASAMPLHTFRRNLLKDAGGIAALAAMGIMQPVASELEHHHVVDDTRSRLIDSAVACIKTGDACSQQHHGM